MTHPLCLVKGRKYNPGLDYSSITDEYPSHEFYKSYENMELYYFAWFNSDTCMSDSYDWGNSVSVYGDTYMTDCYEYDDESHPATIGPLCPPLQGPPPPSQIYWSFPGYPVFYDVEACKRVSAEARARISHPSDMLF